MASSSSSRDRVLSWPPSASRARCIPRRSSEESARLVVERERQRVDGARAASARLRSDRRAADDDHRVGPTRGDALRAWGCPACANHVPQPHGHRSRVCRTGVRRGAPRGAVARDRPMWGARRIPHLRVRGSDVQPRAANRNRRHRRARRVRVHGFVNRVIGSLIGNGMRARYPERIVCLTEETTETLYLLGQGDRIVGVSGYTVRPPEARLKPKVSAFINAKFDKIEALRPDLVLAFSDLQADLAAELVRRGLTVVTFNQRSISEILRMIRMVGGLVGCQMEAERL